MTYRISMRCSMPSAAKLGTDTAYISRIENDAITPSVGAFFRIANALGYSVELVHSIQ